jgi:hypothetical protein
VTQDKAGNHPASAAARPGLSGLLQRLRRTEPQPSGPDADFVVEAEDPEEKKRRIRRSVLAKRKASHLPNSIDNPFYAELLERWPVAPTLAFPVSQICTASQFEEDAYRRVCRAMRVRPTLLRKQWEFAFIVKSLEDAGVIGNGSRGLVFGVGREKLPAIFIARGARITATDLPSNEGDGQWTGGSQHAGSVDNIYHPNLVDRKTFDANIEFRPVNMNHIPEDLRGYDFCWSSCALEHLGTLELGLEFIRNSLKCLKPGGVAVHTTEFNLGSASDTLEEGPAVVYRESDLTKFREEMVAAGHAMSLNLHPGDTPTDRMVDRDRDSDIHLRLYVRHKILATSVGLCIRKAG